MSQPEGDTAIGKDEQNLVETNNSKEVQQHVIEEEKVLDPVEDEVLFGKEEVQSGDNMESDVFADEDAGTSTNVDKQLEPVLNDSNNDRVLKKGSRSPEYASMEVTAETGQDTTIAANTEPYEKRNYKKSEKPDHTDDFDDTKEHIGTSSTKSVSEKEKVIDTVDEHGETETVNTEMLNAEQPLTQNEQGTIQLPDMPDSFTENQDQAQNNRTIPSKIEEEQDEQLKNDEKEYGHTEDNQKKHVESLEHVSVKEDLSNDVFQGTIKVDQEEQMLPSEKTGDLNDEQSQRLIVPQSHEIVIPSYSRWFHLLKIHEIEVKSLPEFFTNRIPSKTPQVYVKYRNFMVNSYRINPNEYFTVIAARRNLCGDAGALFRIHQFLTKWGLINYQVNPTKKPRMIEPPFTGDYETRHDVPRGLFPFQSYKPPLQAPDVSKLKELMNENGNGNRKRSLEETQSPSIPLKTAHNESVEATVQNAAENIAVSPKEENSITDHSDTDRISKRAKIAEWVDNDWTKEDLVKLINAIKTYGTDWMKIAENVGSKTPEQCILRFLQLPIEDAFLLDEKEMGILKFGSYVPFNKSDNPVMSTIAFLVGLVDPEIVQELTKRAISLHDRKSEIPDMDGRTTVKDGTEISLASMGLRSHVFATNQERLMNKITNELINTQLNKIDLKLKTLETMEKSLELERKGIQKKQEDVFVQRLSLAKYATNLMNKFKSLIAQIPENGDTQNALNEIKELIDDPPKASFISQPSTGNSQDSDATNNPISIEAPQLYRYWSG